jgi:hypothetical protein
MGSAKMLGSTSLCLLDSKKDDEAAVPVYA